MRRQAIGLMWLIRPAGKTDGLSVNMGQDESALLVSLSLHLDGQRITAAAGAEAAQFGSGNREAERAPQDGRARKLPVLRQDQSWRQRAVGEGKLNRTGVAAGRHALAVRNANARAGQSGRFERDGGTSRADEEIGRALIHLRADLVK